MGSQARVPDHSSHKSLKYPSHLYPPLSSRSTRREMAWGVLPLEMGEGRPRRLRFHLFPRTQGHGPQTKGQTILRIISSLCTPPPQEFPPPRWSLGGIRGREGVQKQQGKTIQPNHWGGVRLDQGPGPALSSKEPGEEKPGAVRGSGQHLPFQMKPHPWGAQR